MPPKSHKAVAVSVDPPLALAISIAQRLLNTSFSNIVHRAISHELPEALRAASVYRSRTPKPAPQPTTAADFLASISDDASNTEDASNTGSQE